MNEGLYPRSGRALRASDENDQLRASPSRVADLESPPRSVFHSSTVGGLFDKDRHRAFRQRQKQFMKDGGFTYSSSGLPIVLPDPPVPIPPVPIPNLGIGDSPILITATQTVDVEPNGGTTTATVANIPPSQLVQSPAADVGVFPTHTTSDQSPGLSKIVSPPAAAAAGAVVGGRRGMIDSSAVKPTLVSAESWAASSRGFSALELEPVRSIFDRLRSAIATDIGAFRRKESHRHNPSYQPKPSALKAEELVNDDFFQAGDEPLPEHEVILNTDAIKEGHKLHCSKCKGIDGIDPSCYFNKLLKCLVCGFVPAIDPGSDGVPIPQYLGQGSDGNHKSADAFPQFVSSQIEAMLDRGALKKCTRKDGQVVSPLGVAIPKSVRRQAKMLTNINIVDQPSLDAVNAFTAAHGIDLPIKCRLILDAKGSGVNDVLLKQSFSFVSPEDVAAIMTPDCYFASCDASRYYYHFLMAAKAREMMVFSHEGQDYEPFALPFGVSSAPKLVSAVSAELLAIIKAKGAEKALVLMDDFLVVGEDRQQAIAAQEIMKTLLGEAGVTVNHEKDVDPTKVMVFAGTKYNSTTMEASVNPASAGRCAATLSMVLPILGKGLDLSRSDIRHLGGKFADYAKVCQQAKTKAHSVWKYLKYGRNLWPEVREKLVKDLEWWSAKLIFWSKGGSGSCYPIVNQSTLNRPGAISISITDWAGIHGFGGLKGDLHDTNPRFFTNQHPESRDKESSFVGELKVLLHDLRDDLEKAASSNPSGIASPLPPPIIKIWVTDNESAAFALNSGRCSDDIGLAVLEQIFEIADTLRLSLLAVWLDRDSNTIADDLSHLAYLMNVREFEGNFSDLPDRITKGPGSFSRGPNSDEAFGQTSGRALRQVHSFSPESADGLRCGSRVPDTLHAREQGSHRISLGCTEQASNSAQREKPSMADARGGAAIDEAAGSVPAGGHHPNRTQVPTSHSHRHGGNQQVESGQRVGTPMGDLVAGGDPGPPADDRSHGGPEGERLHLEKRSSLGGRPVGRHPPGCYQDLSSRRRSLRGACGWNTGLRVPEQAFHGTQAPSQAGRVRVLYGADQHPISSPQGFREVVPQADQEHCSIHWSEPQPLQRPFLPSGRSH